MTPMKHYTESYEENIYRYHVILHSRTTDIVCTNIWSLCGLVTIALRNNLKNDCYSCECGRYINTSISLSNLQFGNKCRIRDNM